MIDKVLMSTIPIELEALLGAVFLGLGGFGLARRQALMDWQFRVLPPTRRTSRGQKTYFWWSHVLGMLWFCIVGIALLLAAAIRAL